MKNLLVLAGGSPHNKIWGESCEEYFKKEFELTFFNHYDHWTTGESNLNFDVELGKIAEIVKGACDHEWVIFAKSIGSILTIKAVEAEIIKPNKCVFFGMPFNLVADSVFKNNWEAVQNFEIPSLAFHNDNDPTANYEFTKEKLHSLAPNISLISLPGNTHDYLDFSVYEGRINTFLL